MSVRSTVELAGACVVLLTAFLAAIFWIQAGDAEAAQTGLQAVSLHESHHTTIDTAILNRLNRLEVKVDTNIAWLGREEALLKALDTRTELILETVLKD